MCVYLCTWLSSSHVVTASAEFQWYFDIWTQYRIEHSYTNHPIVNHQMQQCENPSSSGIKKFVLLLANYEKIHIGFFVNRFKWHHLLFRSNSINMEEKANKMENSSHKKEYAILFSCERKLKMKHRKKNVGSSFKFHPIMIIKTGAVVGKYIFSLIASA